MISFTTIIIGIAGGILLAGVYVGILISTKNKSEWNKPSMGVSLSILLQVLVLLLFFSSLLPKIPETLITVLWWGAVLFGGFFAVKDFKNNAVYSLVVLVVSGIMAVFGSFIYLISCM